MPILYLTALSWVVVISVAALVIDAGAVAFGSLPYPDASPRIALATLCLAIAIETFIRVLRRA